MLPGWCHSPLPLKSSSFLIWALPMSSATVLIPIFPRENWWSYTLETKSCISFRNQSSGQKHPWCQWTCLAITEWKPGWGWPWCRASQPLVVGPSFPIETLFLMLKWKLYQVKCLLFHFVSSFLLNGKMCLTLIFCTALVTCNKLHIFVKVPKSKARFMFLEERCQGLIVHSKYKFPQLL